MGSVRPWQVAVIAISLIVVGISLFFTLRNQNKVEFSNEVFLFDVVSAELFVYGTDRGGVVLPAIHPDTGERTLLKVVREENGQWSLEGRDLGRLDEFEELNEAAIDLQSGAVSPTNRSPRRIRKQDFLKHLGGEG